MIEKKDVRRIAKLARIELDPAEEERFEKELSAILKFVEKLNEVDTKNVLPLTGGTTLDTVMRGDGSLDASLEGKSGEILRQAPEKKENWVKVKAVFK